jgi:VWFA-related protein
MKVCLAVLSALVLVAPAAASDTTVFGDRVEVELVLVDVVVEDKGGDPVLDLGVEEFAVFQDGKPVEISQFTPARGGRTTHAAAANAAVVATPAVAAASSPRRLILFLDNLHLHPNSRHRVMTRLAAQLDEYLDPQDEVMVVAYGGTTEVLLPITRDRGALKKVLREQASSGAVSLLASYSDERILQIIENRHSEETLTSGFVAGDACVDLGGIAHAHAQQVHNRVVGTIYELDRFVNSLAGYEGRKMLLHVSDGIPLVPGAEAYRFASELCDGTAANKGNESGVDTAMFGSGKFTRWDPTQTSATLQEFNTADEWNRLAGNANTYQVSFYMFQAHMATGRAASTDSARTSFDTEMAGKHNKQDPLFLLSDETGGMALLNTNDIERVLTRINEDSASSYQLAYVPPTPGDGKQHGIDVKITRPGVRVRHRKSYQSKNADERIADRVVSALIHGQFENPLGVRLKVAEQTPGERDISNVRLNVRVPLSALVLLPEEEVNRGLFTVFVVASGAHGQLTPVGQKTVPVRVPLEGKQTDFVYTVEVPVRGADGQIAVAVQDQIGGETSYLRERVRPQSGS